jgi:thioredoxin reductase (NADPH)
VSGGRLAQQAYEQAWVFGADFVFMQRVTGLGRDDSGLFVILSESGRVNARAVALAMGATYRRIGIPALEALNGAGVFYGGPASEAPAMAGRDVYVLGGANSAGQAALHLARYAKRVTLIARAPSLRAGMSEYLVQQARKSRTSRFVWRRRSSAAGATGLSTISCSAIALVKPRRWSLPTVSS